MPTGDFYYQNQTQLISTTDNNTNPVWDVLLDCGYFDAYDSYYVGEETVIKAESCSFKDSIIEAQEVIIEAQELIIDFFSKKSSLYDLLYDHPVANYEWNGNNGH